MPSIINVILISFLANGILPNICIAQNKNQANKTNTTLVSAGPLLGWVAHRSANIWLAVNTSNEAKIEVFELATNKLVFSQLKTTVNNEAAHILNFEVGNLIPSTKYVYQIFTQKGVFLAESTFKTQVLWEWRMPAPDFSFILGSCTYVNDSVFDRPGKPYGNNPNVFEHMATTNADFMLWLGDNTYFREADYSSKWGMAYRHQHTRALPQMQPLLKAMPNIALWDDHDFGPNDSDAGFILKSEARDLFKSYWPNQTFGEDGKGIYTKWSFNDCDFFLMDNRFFRDNNDWKPTINNKPNQNKRMLGADQLKWLQQSLLKSKAPFKFIVGGGQWINPLNDKECFNHFPFEYNELFDFLKSYAIEGVVFISGDRHFSEIIVDSTLLDYPVFDITCSPLTSGVAHTVLENGKPEADNPHRIFGSLVAQHNFGNITISGKRGERVLTVKFMDSNGKPIFEHSIAAKKLRTLK